MTECPYCGCEIDPHKLYAYFTNEADYATDFKFDCHCCHEAIAVDVMPIPEFTLSKKGDNL